MKDNIKIVIAIILIFGLLVCAGYDVFLHNDFCQLLF